MVQGRRKNFREDDEPSYLSGEDQEGEYCRVCKQEYTNRCPIASANCPFENESEDGEEDAVSDFDDVENLGEVLADDEEADRLAEESDEDIPPEDRE